MKIRYNPIATKAFAEAPSQIQKAFLKQAAFLVQNPHHPSLHAKKYDDAASPSRRRSRPRAAGPRRPGRSRPRRRAPAAPSPGARAAAGWSTETSAGTSSRAAASFCSISRSRSRSSVSRVNGTGARAERRPCPWLLDHSGDRQQRPLAGRDLRSPGPARPTRPGDPSKATSTRRTVRSSGAAERRVVRRCGATGPSAAGSNLACSLAPKTVSCQDVLGPVPS